MARRNKHFGLLLDDFLKTEGVVEQTFTIARHKPGNSPGL